MTVKLRSVAELVAHGFVETTEAGALGEVASRYAIAVTPAMAGLIDGLPNDDPIARQFIPTLAELSVTPNELADPIGDDAHSPLEGIVHRYPDRVLLKLTGACAVYCRFCFRRETVGPGHAAALSADALAAALAYVAKDLDIWEVVLTGGDPLALSPRRLGEVAEALGRIAHVKVLRVHSRVPVVAPEAIDDALCSALNAAGKAVYVAVHANHPRELTAAARQACRRLAGAGAILVSQSVLLRGVNDDLATLRDLMRGFVEAGIKPYYLHHPDLAPGTAHFRLTIAEGQQLVGALRGAISGLCQPHYVLDLPGGFGKSPIGPNYVEQSADGLRIRDFKGVAHAYSEGEDTGAARG